MSWDWLIVEWSNIMTLSFVTSERFYSMYFFFWIHEERIGDEKVPQKKNLIQNIYHAFLYIILQEKL